jgi:hypothetical protein
VGGGWVGLFGEEVKEGISRGGREYRDFGIIATCGMM